jgi:membrane fusion protein, multidrug efflux system
MRKLAVVLIALLVGGVLAYQEFLSDPAEPGAAPAAAGAPCGPGMGMPVEAEAARAETVRQEIIAVGSLRSNESVTLSAEIAGRIARIHFREGQPVAAGALLFELDDSVYRAELEQARAALGLSQRNHERSLELFERKLISARERDEAAARLDVDRATVALAQARFDKTRIRAPFAGIVGLRAVSPGDYINPGQPLAPLEQLSVLKADFRLSEAALPAVAVGQELKLEVDAYPGRAFPGRVYAIDPRLAEDTRSIGLRARVPNEHGLLRPGLFARVKLVVAERAGAVLVPEQSIVPRGEELFVYVIEDGKAQIRPVSVGLRQGGRAEITSGVKPGEMVITAGVQKIGPGAPVMPINSAPPPAEPETAPDAPAEKS